MIGHRAITHDALAYSSAPKMNGEGQMAKKQRLTDRLNLALSRASAAVAIGKDNPEHSQACCAGFW